MPKFVEVPTEDWLSTIKDAKRWRKARMILAVEDIERADAEMAGFTATAEENEKADAAIDAARDR